MDPVQDNPQATGDAGEKTVSDFQAIMGSMGSDPKPAEKPAADVATGEKDKGNKENDPETEGKAPAWTSQLPEEMRSNADVMKQLTKFNKIGDLAKSYSELESKLGNSFTKPRENASSEEIEAFYQKLGKPATADEYEIDDKEAKEFKELAYKHNLTNAQAVAMYKDMVANAQQLQQDQQQATYQKARETEEALKAEFGNHYSEKLVMLQRGVNTYGGASLGDKLKNSGLLFDKDVAKMFILLGEQAAEAEHITRSASAKNYKSIADGGFMDFGNDFK